MSKKSVRSGSDEAFKGNPLVQPHALISKKHLSSSFCPSGLLLSITALLVCSYFKHGSLHTPNIPPVACLAEQPPHLDADGRGKRIQ